MLYLDLETYSNLDIKKTSLDQYANHPSTRILMCAYAEEEGPVSLWTYKDGAAALRKLQSRMSSETCVAWNVGFEHNLTTSVWKMKGVEWLDAMVFALYAALPAGLKDCNKVPYFASESETSKETLLINKFCKPSSKAEVHNADTDPEDWKAFGEYCQADVHDTRLIWQWLAARFDPPARFWDEWRIDRRINARGMPIDRVLVERALLQSQRLQVREAARLSALTSLDNPNSPTQLIAWLQERGYPYTSLSKELVLKALKEDPETGGKDEVQYYVDD